MKIARLGSLFLTGAGLWAGYQTTYTDNLTGIDSSKWAQIGNLSVGSNGVTGNGSLISTVAVPTASDYDVRMTIHTANPGPCTGSYTLYARSTPDNTTSYVLRIEGGSLDLYREVANSWTLLSTIPSYCSDGTVIRLVVRGNSITTWSGPNTATYQDANPIAAGQPGVGISSSSGDTIGDVQIGPIDYAAPSAISASAVETSTAANRVDLRWPASAADANSAGLQGYIVYRDGIYLGSPRTPNWLDQTVTGGETTTYSIYAADQHGSLSAPAAVTVAVPEGLASFTAKPGAEANLRRPTAKSIPTGPSVDQREVGVRPTGSYWGAAGENIDLLSGNLNFSIPLIKAMGRGGSSVTFALSYNSQMWRQESNGTPWLLGEDVGVGEGWTFQAGSILPILYNGSVEYYIYTDSTGAQYILDQQNGSVWSSLQGIYVWFDAALGVLHFRDGSFWNMNVVSASTEQDHGTMYPSQMEDSNGNFITIQYGPAIGSPYWYNNSSRITSIFDARGGSYFGTYSIAWYGSGLHLTSITNSVGTSENYSFSTASQTLLDPFTSSSFGSATVLQSVTVTGLGIGHLFQYNSSAEMIQWTAPLGGVIYWSYAPLDYTARNYEGVEERDMSGGPSGQGDTVYIGLGSYPNWTGMAVVTDTGSNWTQQQWTFSTVSNYTAGLATSYQETDINGTDLQKNYTWAQSSSSNPYVATLTSTLNPGQSYAASTTTNQEIDAYGNLTQQQVTDYANSGTGTRTYNMTYPNQNNGSQFLPYYIFNRMISATVTPSGGSPLTLSSTVFDVSCGGWYMTSTNATNNHDPAYTATGGPPRGNPWWVSGLNGGDTTCTVYDSAGVPISVENSSGQSVGLQTDSTTNYSLPTIIQPNGNSGMQTIATYASSWAPTSMMGPNGGQATTTYDSYGRPSQSTTPDTTSNGGTTTYTYAYYNPVTNTGSNTQTATLDGRWQTTTLDGFGRTIQVQKGNGSTVVSTVQTQYRAAATSPLGKIYEVSEPYAPGATAVWTKYTYDGSGRTLKKTAPDGNSTTNYTYQGNSTTVTDPAGKWKTSTVDAYGNLVKVTEPNPAGGTFTTNYTYTPANQLTTVSMTRGSVTQTRTFVYNGSDMVSATNPENGTVTYTYDGAHHVLSRTDALGAQTQYTYDSYGRLTQSQYYPTNLYGFGGGTEDTVQRVNYYYDNTLPSVYTTCTPPYGCTPPFTGSLNGMGLLTGVSFEGGIRDSLYNTHYYAYAYQYNTAGRITGQNVEVMAATGSSYYNLQPVNPPIATFTASYQWDDEGRMTSMQSPTVTPNSYSNWPYPTVMPTIGYQYDINGRLSGMTSNGSTYATATYNATGQLLTLAGPAGTETRTYNSNLQMITQSMPGYLNMTYYYSATQNNGRITSSVDGITGEGTWYTYDALNRLTAAQNSSWNEAYGYDGFGNLTSKAGQGGSPNSAPSMSVSYNANNQQVGASYDANGNTSSFNGSSVGYTVENKMNSQTSSTYPYGVSLYAYDPNGKRVMKETNPDPNNYEGEYNPAWEFYFYSITGQRLVTMDCSNPNANPLPSCSVVGENVYFGKKLLVSNGVNVVTDRLGSVRANTQGNSFAYYPYGEERTSTVNGLDKFGTYFRDAVGQDYAQQRYYNASLGRFWTVDPGGIRTAHMGNPASWNRYAYVNGDPINFGDPMGLDDEPAGIPGCDVSYTGDLTGPQSACSAMSFATTTWGGGWGAYTTAPASGFSQDGTVTTVDQASALQQGTDLTQALTNFWLEEAEQFCDPNQPPQQCTDNANNLASLLGFPPNGTIYDSWETPSAPTFGSLTPPFAANPSQSSPSCPAGEYPVNVSSNGSSFNCAAIPTTPPPTSTQASTAASTGSTLRTMNTSPRPAPILLPGQRIQW